LPALPQLFLQGGLYLLLDVLSNLLNQRSKYLVLQHVLDVINHHLPLFALETSLLLLLLQGHIGFTLRIGLLSQSLLFPLRLVKRRSNGAGSDPVFGDERMGPFRSLSLSPCGNGLSG